MARDRTALIPAHRGRHVLPNSPFFSRLLRYAHRRPPRIAIRDHNLGVEKTYLQLLTDVLALRKAIESTLNLSTLLSLERGEEIYMCMLAAGGYEYAVAFLAILAIGAAAVPLSEFLSSKYKRTIMLTVLQQRRYRQRKRRTSSSNPAP